LALEHLHQVYTDVMCHASLSDRASMLNLVVKCQLSIAASDKSVNRSHGEFCNCCTTLGRWGLSRTVADGH